MSSRWEKPYKTRGKRIKLPGGSSEEDDEELAPDLTPIESVPYMTTDVVELDPIDSIPQLTTQDETG